MQDFSYTLIDMFRDGGWFMYPLLLCSLFAVGVIIAKAYTLWAAGRHSKRIMNEVEALTRAGKLNDAVELTRTEPGPVAAILNAGLTRLKDRFRGEDIETAVKSIGVIELGFLERGLAVLATIANVAPLLGFLGTVAGMISAFGAIAEAGQVEATLVAGGIKVALITTATGLIIAIPVNISYNYFVTRIDKLIRAMEEGTSHVLNLVWDLERGGTAAVGTVAGLPRHGHVPVTGSVEGMGTPDPGARPDSDHQP